MTVKDLIAKLAVCDSKATVFGWDYENETCIDIEQVIEHEAMTLRKGEWIVTSPRKGATAHVKGVIIK